MVPTPAPKDLPTPPIGRRLRHKLLALWLGSILGVLLLVGLVLTAFMNDFRSREARNHVAAAMTQVRHELVGIASELQHQAGLLATSREVVATINMVHRYQDVTQYQPLVFDAEKQSLALKLAERLGATGIHFAAVYDGHGRPAAWAAAGGFPRAGFHTVASGKEILMAREDGTWQPTQAPPLLRAGDWTAAVEDGDVVYLASKGRLVLETVAPIERVFGDTATPMVVGYVHLARVMDEEATERLSKRTETAIGVVAGGVQIGALPPLAPADLASAPTIDTDPDCPCHWVEVEDMTVGVSAVPLDDGGRAHVLVGTSNAETKAVLRYYQLSATLVLLAVAGVVAPGGLLLLTATIVRPLSRLLHGVEALKHGRRIHLAEQFRDDEFGVLARGFDDMAGAIAEREDQLRATIDQLAHSNSELERFAVVAAHDLQEPLRMVASYTQLLKRRYHGHLGADADEFIDYAVDGAERMKALIQNLLDYSRVDADQAPYGPVDCDEVVRGVLAVMADVVEESRAAIEVAPLPTVRGNAVQLGQVFQNLLSNALKFRRGIPEIIITARREGHEWVFAVADNGIGIAAEYLPQLFTLFRRLHTRQEYPGVGLGLAIARRIVERHGGRMWAESEEGHGTTMYFTLPAHDPAMPGARSK
ncbi:MAG: ATP-binding protein [Pseudomonadota bacterium]